MPSLPAAIIAAFLPFAPLFSRPVWRHAQVLLVGAVLCRGPRTVTAVLRVMGVRQDQRFEKYHRVLSRARWSGLQGAKILLGMLGLLLPASWPIVVGADETIERRRGWKITAKGCYRDAVRSTEKHVITCFGLTWIAMMLLVPVPWSSRPMPSWTFPLRCDIHSVVLALLLQFATRLRYNLAGLRHSDRMTSWLSPWRLASRRFVTQEQGWTSRISVTSASLPTSTMANRPSPTVCSKQPRP